MNTIFGSKKHEGLVANNGDPITARTWDSGNIDGYSYQALVFPEPSDYGINNGNISKLSIKAPNGKLVVSYDRGWDIEPAGKSAKAILDKVLARYTVEQSSETKCNEAFAVYRGGPGYSSSFMIDCGSPERAKALADAIQEEAYDHPLDSAKDDAGRHFLGGEIVQFWPVDRYFTATVDPCDKAIEWCQEFLNSLDGEISALTGNDAGLESIKNESTLSSLLAKNPVWNEIGGGDTADLADSIEKGEWIGLMTGAEDDTDAGWDKYIADTFGPTSDFADFVDGRYIKPDEREPDFRVAQIKFKPLFNRLSTNTKAGLLTDLGAALSRGYFAESKGAASEDRRGTDRYGHHVKRFTTKDLKGLDGEVTGGSGDNAGAADTFGLAYLDTTSISAFSNNFSPSARDNFLHDLAQMPISKKSIEDLLRKHQLHKYGRTVGLRDFFPENGIAYLGTIGDDGLPSKSLYLKWGPALKK